MVSIGPYSLVTVPLYAGPLFAATPGSETERLATLLNHAVDLPTSGIAEAIEQGRVGGNALISVSPPEDDEDDRRLRDAWAARTSERLPPSSVARIDMAGYDGPFAIPWAVLRAGLAELRARRAAWKPEPGPWLFMRPARSPFVTPEDHALVRRLDDEAAAIDALDLDAEVGREPQSLIDRRRTLLRACRDAGVFAPDHGEVREQWLLNWKADVLLALRRAGAQLRAFGILGDGEEPPAGAACLDYARLALWPPGEDGASWARSVLPLVPRDDTGEQGALVERVGGSTVRIWWRRDDDRPALLAISHG